VHEAALPAEDASLGSEDRFDTFEGDLAARFATALLTTALFTALVTALF
jgi:hypothetical protein